MPTKPAGSPARKSAKTAAKPAAAKAADGPRINRWLLKSEPDSWSWQQQVARGATGEEWTGVRNFQARNNMRAMVVGDLGFFYHSNEGKEIVGIVEVVEAVHPDPSDETGKWECVKVVAVEPLPRPVSLDEAKTIPELADMVLVNNTRLSVQPVTTAQWEFICKLGGVGSGKPAGKQARA